MAIAGAKPPGDPDQMIENAGRILVIVAEIESQASAVAAAKTAGSGGVVQRANAGTGNDAAKLRSAASALESAASSLRTAGFDLRDRQHAWDKRVHALEGQLQAKAQAEARAEADRARAQRP